MNIVDIIPAVVFHIIFQGRLQSSQRLDAWMRKILTIDKNRKNIMLMCQRNYDFEIDKLIQKGSLRVQNVFF